LQFTLWQSAATPHFFPAMHAGHGPPQSVSDSLWFCTKSEQVAAWHVALVQTPLWQSVAWAQPPPVPQVGQVPPPQSTPVSLPFFTPSVHVDALHTPETQLLLAQSDPFEHVPPSGHPGHEPPQSIPVSVPFLTPSLQPGWVHTPPVQ
jgi:hypothetical protein